MESTVIYSCVDFAPVNSILTGSKYTVSQGVEVDAGFDGCINQLKTGNHVPKLVDFNKDVIEASNVKDCSLIDQIQNCPLDFCKNGGECVTIQSKAKCLCPWSYFAETCTKSKSDTSL